MGDATNIPDWENLPILLHSSHLQAIYRVNGKTISRWNIWGRIPNPAVSAGSIRRWDRESIRRHFEGAKFPGIAAWAGAAIARPPIPEISYAEWHAMQARRPDRS